MKKTRYTEEQIAFALKQTETSPRVGEVCRKMGISEATFYNWKKKFAGPGVTELRRLRQLEDENQWLKKLVAELSLNKEMLQEVAKKLFFFSCTNKIKIASSPTARICILSVITISITQYQIKYISITYPLV